MQERDLILLLGGRQEGVNISFAPDPGGNTPHPKNLLNIFKERGVQLLAPGEYSRAIDFCAEYDRLEEIWAQWNHMRLGDDARRLEQQYNQTGNPEFLKQAQKKHEELRSGSYVRPRTLAKDHLKKHYFENCVPLCIQALERELEALISITGQIVQNQSNECERFGLPWPGRGEGQAFRSMAMATWIVHSQIKSVRLTSGHINDCIVQNPRGLLVNAMALYEMQHPADAKPSKKK